MVLYSGSFSFRKKVIKFWVSNGFKTHLVYSDETKRIGIKALFHFVYSVQYTIKTKSKEMSKDDEIKWFGV